MAASQPHFASASLYVGDLDPEVNETMLFELFNTIGPVASIRVCRETGTRKSLGYAYVNYHSVSDAERSLDTLNYTPIKGVPCRIMWSHRDPSLRRSGAGNIFVKNLDKMVDNKALYDTFSLFGNILSCKVATDEFGKSKGYGFVHYESEESGQAAIEKVNNMQIGSKTVYVGPFKRRVERQDHVDKNSAVFTNLYVKQFPAEWTEETLRSIFEPFGEITSLALTTDSMNRRFAFVNFASPDSAKSAVEALHGKRTTLTGVIMEETDAEDESSVAAGDLATSSSTTTSRAQPGAVDKEKKAQGDETTADKDSATQKLASKTHGEGQSEPQTKEATTDEQTKKTQTQKADEDDTKTTTAAPSTVAGDDKDSKMGANAERQCKEGVEAPPKTATPDESISTATEGKKDTRSGALTAANITNRLYVQRAMTKAERQSLLRETFSVASDKNQKQQTGVNLYVKNLDDQVTDDMLREAFSKFGTVTSAKVMLDSSGVSRGFGFVCFAFPEEATKALTAMHLKLFQGKPLYVGLAEKRDHRVARLQQRYRLSNASRGGQGAASNVLPPQAAATGLSAGSVPPASAGGPLMTPHQSYYAGNHYYPGNTVRGVNHHALQQHYSVGAAGPSAWRQQQSGVPGAGGPLGSTRQYYGVASSGATGVVAPPPPGAMLHQQLPAGAGPEGTPAYPLMGSAAPPANMMAGAMRGATAGNHHQHLGPSHHHRSRNAPSGAGGGMPGAGSGQQNFKFTSQARNNRQDFITGPMATVATSGAISSYQQSQQGGTTAGGYIQQAPPSAHMLMGGAPSGTGPALDVSGAMLGPGGLSEMPLSAQTLATAHPQMQKQILGEKLFPLVYKHQPELAGKITGMMLEMDNAELLSLLESDALLQAKVDEALGVLRRHHHQAAAASTRPLAPGPAAPSARPAATVAAVPQPSSRSLKSATATSAAADSSATTASTSTAPTSGETTATPAGAPVPNGNASALGL